ncbi:MAG TPA: DsbA family protein [Flavitalea sp.]|nr:DsbA family protein [Flavitalea sp.]
METGAEFHIHITVYTDPLCCWSWAFDPELKKLKQTLAWHSSWKTCMGGLIPSWNNYHDEVNAVTRPVQMGPVWVHAAQIARRPINHLVWMKDPPSSSYPACVAVKSAQLQSEHAGDQMLQLLRNAVMTDGKNISRPEVIMQAAKELAEADNSFDIHKFTEDYNGEPGRNAFKEDLQKVKLQAISRFPALIIKLNENKTIMLSGYRSYDDVMGELVEVYPALENIISGKSE